MRKTEKLSISLTITTLLLANAAFGEPQVPYPEDNWNLVTTRPSSQPNNADFKRGLVNVLAYGATVNDGTDDTAAIQAAIYDAYEYQLVCYFPTGTYDVTDTLDCLQAANNRRYAYVLQGQKGNPVSNRPVIRLRSNASGFGNANDPKPVIKVWAKNHMQNPTDPGVEQPSRGFNNVIRGIDIDTNGKVGATGVYFAGAQGCSLEDMRIQLTGSFAGFSKCMGVNGGYYNVEVEGGKYGIYIQPHNDPVKPSKSVVDTFPIFVGCRFYNQTSRVLWTKGRCPVTFVGFHIKKASGPAFESLSNSHEQGGCLTLMDGVIELTNNGVAIDNNYSNSQSRSVYIKDVYFKNASTMIQNGAPTYNVAGTSNGWTEVLEYGRALTGKPKVGRNLINGVQGAETPNISTSVINQNFSASSVPSADSCINNHVWDEAAFPAFDDPDTFDAVVDGGLSNTYGADATAALNNILATNNKVFLPKGRYKISGTITIPGNTMLFGISRTNTTLRPNYNAWDPSTEKYIVTTDNNADASPLLSNVWLDYTHLNPGEMISLIHWRAGRNSAIRNIFGWDNKYGSLAPMTDGFASLDKRLYKFTGNAGGRIWGLTSGWQKMGQTSAHDNFRSIYVEGTSQPLNFYGYNVERILGSYQSEFRNASNVNIFGAKTEGENPNAHKINREDFRPMLGIVNCDNIVIGTVATSVSGCKDGWVQVVDSTNVLCANITSQNHDGSSEHVLYMIQETNGGTTSKVSAQAYSTTHFQRGIATLNEFDGTNPPPPPAGVVEVESLLPVASSSGDGATSTANTGASGGEFVWYGSNGVGDYVTVDLNVSNPGLYQVYLGNGTTPNSGTVQVSIGGSNVGSPQDLYSSGYIFEERDIGTVALPTGGTQQCRFEITGKNASSSSYIMRLDCIRLVEIQTSFENEALTIAATSGDSTSNSSNASSSGGEYVWFGSNAAGDYITFDVDVPNAGTYQIYTGIGTTPSSGRFQLEINGNDVGSVQDLYSTAYIFEERSIGTYNFASAGIQQFRYSVTGKNAASSNYILRLDTIRIESGSANTAPALTAVSNKNMNEGGNLTVNLSATDADSDPITLSTTGLPSFGTLSDNGDGTGSLSFTPGFGDGGSYVITVTASDGTANDSQAFTLSVNDVNLAPVLTAINNSQTSEATTHSVSFSATDADQDSLTFSATGLPSFASITDNGNGTGSITFTPGYSDSGSYSITVSVNDGRGGVDSDSFTLTVNNLNQQPSIGGIANQSVNENSSINVGVSATDPDANDVLTLAASGLPTFGNLIDNGDGTGSITFTPGYSDSGSYSISISVDDGNGGVDSDSFTLTVNNLNQQPSIGGIANQNVNENSSINVGVNATDPDANDVLTLAASGLPTFGNLIDNGDGTGSITFTPGYSDSGSYSISISVDDGNGGVDSDSFTLTVNNLNQQPSIGGIANQSVNENSSINVGVSATDPDANDVLTLAASGLPTFGNLIDNGDGTGSITFTPGNSDSGSYSISISVDDGNGGVDSDTFTLTVNNLNQQPSIGALSNQSVEENSSINVSVNATDPDTEDALTLSASSLPAFGSLTDNGDGSGSITFAPDYSDSGVYSITISVDDGNGGVDNDTFTLTVNNVNRQPTISGIANQSVEETSSINVGISATDSDTDDILTLSASGLPSFGSLTDNGDGTGTLSFNPDTNTTGNYNLTITVNDGNATNNTDNTSCVLTVNPTSQSISFYENDFTSGSIEPDFAGNTNDYTISGGKLNPTNAWKRIYLNTPGANSLTDYTVEVDATTTTPGTGNRHTAPVLLRYQSSSQFYLVQVDKNGKLLILKKGGGWTTLGSSASGAFPISASYKIDIYGANPTTIDVYVNGAQTPSLSGTDSASPYLQGPPAFEARGTTSMEWDNLVVTEGGALYANDFESGTPDTDFDPGSGTINDWSFDSFGTLNSETQWRTIYLNAADAGNWTDYTLTVDVDNLAPGAGNKQTANVLVRYNQASPNNYYGILIDKQNNLYIGKKAGGWNWGLASTTGGLFDHTIPHTLKIDVRGSSTVTIDVYVDGAETPSLTAVDNSNPHTSGGVGFENRGVEVAFDNLVVE